MSPTGGAKTHPSGAPWGRKYVNVRCLLVYIEHFIDEGANWAVFERKEALQEKLRRGAMTRWRDAPFRGRPDRRLERSSTQCDIGLFLSRTP
jgi:hypothetical protein